MLKKLLSGLSLLSCLFLLAAPPAKAQLQHFWARQKHTYANGELYSLPDGKSVVHQLAPLSNPELTMFRHAVFDTLLRQRQQASFIMRGYDMHLTAHALNQRAALYRFRRKANDTAYTVVADTAGKVLSFRRERRRQALPDLLPPLSLAADSFFVLCNRPNDGQSFTLECVDLQQRVRWQLPFVDKKRWLSLVDFRSLGQYIWAVVSVDREHHTVCIDSRTGKVLSNTPVSQPESQRLVTATLLLPDHSLVLAGRAFPSGTSQHRREIKSGDLFLTRLQPDGTRVLDNVNTNNQPRKQGALSPDLEVYWEHLGIDSAGNYFLMGETFGSTSAASGVAQAVAVQVLTGGVYGFNLTSLTPLDFVRVQFDAQGKVMDAIQVPLPQTGTTLTNLAHWPPQIMAQYAETQGTFRFRAAAADGRTVVLRNKKDLTLLNIDTQQLTELRSGRELETLDVWNSRPGHVLLYRARPDKSPEPKPEWLPLQ